MPDTRIPEPYRTIDLGDGVSASYYILQFDRQGRPENPLTRQQMLAGSARSDGKDPYTDIYVFAHGWNNDWKGATQAYDKFIGGFASLRLAQGDIGRAYRPLLVGVFWPSTTLVFPWEREPKLAALNPEEELEHQTAISSVRQELAECLSAEQAQRFHTLAGAETLIDEGQQREFAALLAAGYGASRPDEVPDADDEATSADDVLKMWREQERLTAAPGARGGMPQPVAGQPGGPSLAGGVSLDPRQALRMFSVWQMKDRAGAVGFHGLGPVLRQLLASSDARVHLVGHSFGCKVCLSALCAESVERKVNSVLLLQPAISALCFAEFARDGKAGGFREAFSRTCLPILSTFSVHDFPLTKVFHLAVRRASDCGEMKIAGPPNPFQALGGFGARGCALGECEVTPLLGNGKGSYPLTKPKVRLFCLMSDEFIKDHGNISQPATWWALLQQVKAN